MSALSSLLNLFRDRTKISDSVRLVPDGRDAVKYIEDDAYVMIVQTELLSGEPSRVIYKSSIDRWEPPNDKVPLEEDKKAAILRAVMEFYQRQGERFIVQ